MNPPLRIRQKDFQRIVDATVEVNGITLLTGLNNQGKTSILRGAKATVAGHGGDRQIRRGAKKAMVGVEYPEDPDNPAMQVAWIKGSGGAEYFIDGEPFKTLGRKGVPTEDLDKKGLKEIKFSGGSCYLMFAMKDELPFLVSLPPTQVFDFVSKILQERKILPVLKTMATDASTLNSGLVTLEGEILTRKGSIQKWTDEKTALDETLKHQPLVLNLQKDITALRRMYQVKEEVKKIIQDSQALAGKIELEEALLDKAVPQVSELEDLLSEMKIMVRDRRELAKVEEELLASKEALQQIEGEIANLPDITRAETLVKELASERTQLQALRLMKKSLEDNDKDAQATKVRLQEAADEATNAESEWDRIKQEIGICPTCGSKIGDCSG